MSDPYQKTPQAAGDLIRHLRLSMRQARRLADGMADNPLVGHEICAIISRLEAINAELQTLQISVPGLRSADNDPLWTQPATVKSGRAPLNRRRA